MKGDEYIADAAPLAYTSPTNKRTLYAGDVGNPQMEKDEAV
jgi:hypothetical protein